MLLDLKHTRFMYYSAGAYLDTCRWPPHNIQNLSFGAARFGDSKNHFGGSGTTGS